MYTSNILANLSENKISITTAYSIWFYGTKIAGEKHFRKRLKSTLSNLHG